MFFKPQKGALRAGLLGPLGLLLAAGCSGHSTPKALPLDLSATGPTLCGGLVPTAVAATMAGTGSTRDSGTLVEGRVGDCAVFRATGKQEQVFRIQTTPFVSSPAVNAYRLVSPQHLTDGRRLLPASVGYGYVGPGGEGSKGHNANALTTSGDVQITVVVLQDAKGRDPVADAQALLQLVGPKLAPNWPHAPTGLDANNPTSPPATNTPSG
jgi:hypothetical protein